MVSDYRLRITWSQPEDLLGHFFAQALSEGLDIEAERVEWVAAGGSDQPMMAGASQTPASDGMRELARKLATRVEEKMQSNPELDYFEFLSELPDSVSRGIPDLETFHGAWLGRAAGCLLGKPVEKTQRDGIRAILQSSGRWPLNEYFTAKGVPSEVLLKHPWNKQSAPNCLQENINGMAEDDDLNYPLIALLTLEKFGREFNTDHIADQWMKLLPAGKVFTAERIAYRNLLNASTPREAGGKNNPFKEWIGALIRTDVYGWINPGNPKIAAQMALRDAWLSHRRNGLYGASMAAAMCAVAMVSQDVDEVIDAGLSVLPSGSQILEACLFAREQGNLEIEYETALDNLYEYVDGMHWVHTINNAASGVMALSRSRGDFSSAITLTVMGGWDTDSIGATIGSICGAMAGVAGIDLKWATPIDDRLASSIPGCDQLKLSELALRTRALAI